MSNPLIAAHSESIVLFFICIQDRHYECNDKNK